MVLVVLADCGREVLVGVIGAAVVATEVGAESHPYGSFLYGFRMSIIFTYKSMGLFTLYVQFIVYYPSV